MHDPERTALAFHRACHNASVPYAFVDGVAVGAWGQPRATNDADALLELPAGKVDALITALAAERLIVDPRDLRHAMSDRTHVSIHDPDTGFHVDVRLVDRSEEREQIHAATEIKLEAGTLRVARAEETIAFKLKYGSPQDIADARSILRRQAGRLDMARLQGFARRLGVQDELATLLQEAEGQ